MATVLSNIGTWMHDVGAGWLMTSLAPSPAWVALVQTATSLPVFLLALPAGALADILDRRRMLLAVQVVMAIVAAGLGVVVLLGGATPVLLLLFTFVMGVGARSRRRRGRPSCPAWCRARRCSRPWPPTAWASISAAPSGPRWRASSFPALAWQRRS
ncbi:hypothetical protein AWV79_36100 [Cupriavidus sp. UYMMa02A]|nr:hypothetical protein AWV79_36100 [Cupriavidus sp. UYMMa02A]